MTGVDRTALNIGRSLARLARDVGPGSLQLDITVPANAPPDLEIRAQLDLAESSQILRSALKGYTWEQMVLPFQSPSAMLLNLCNTAPVVRRQQMVLIHDAQVFDAPESYSAAFRAVYRLLLPAIARRSMLAATVSAHSRERLAANRVGKAGELSIIHNGVDHLDEVLADTSIFDRYGLQPRGYLLTLGSAAPHKNLATVLAALPEKAPPLAVAGGGEAVSRIVRDSGARNVLHLGRVTDGELKALYSSARIFLFPSLTEGFGFPALEAMACGCPTIVSRGGAIPEICDEAAIYCDAKDVAGWRSAIEFLAVDSARQVELIGLGRARAARFSWKESARQIVRLARQAVDHQEQPRSVHQRIGGKQYSTDTGERE